MKESFLLLFAATAVNVHAADPTLVIHTSEGSNFLFPSGGLVIKPQNDKLIVEGAHGSTVLDLAELRSMWFDDDVTETPSVVVEAGCSVEVFTVSGVSLGKFSSPSEARANLSVGTYFLRSNDKSTKIVVK